MPGGIWDSVAGGATGGSAAGPWGAAIGAAGGALSNIFGGGDQGGPFRPGMARIGSGSQMSLFEQIMRAAQNRQGEFGFGQAAQMGNATLKQQMGDRGINSGSGVYNSALAQMLAQAANQDTQNYRNFAMNAAQMQPWVLNSQGYMAGDDYFARPGARAYQSE